MSALLDHPDTVEQIDLTTITDWDDLAVCTSRSQHNCSTDATHTSRSTVPCPDPVTQVLWCDSRYRMHLAYAKHDSANCTYCHRPTTTCWIVNPI